MKTKKSSKRVKKVEVDVRDIERRAERFLSEGLAAIQPIKHPADIDLISKKPMSELQQVCDNYFEKIHKLNMVLLQNIKNNLPELEKLLEEVNDHWSYQDYVYRFYHQSYKAYHTQESTVEMVKALKKLAPPGICFNDFFEEIYKEGTGKTFDMSHNENWTRHTRPLLEAFFHAKYFLEMAVKYGRELKEAPTCLPSGWAGLLCFFNLR